MYASLPCCFFCARVLHSCIWPRARALSGRGYCGGGQGVADNTSHFFRHSDSGASVLVQRSMVHTNPTPKETRRGAAVNATVTRQQFARWYATGGNCCRLEAVIVFLSGCKLGLVFRRPAAGWRMDLLVSCFVFRYKFAAIYTPRTDDLLHTPPIPSLCRCCYCCKSGLCPTKQLRHNCRAWRCIPI